jgi:hypothetical protein
MCLYHYNLNMENVMLKSLKFNEETNEITLVIQGNMPDSSKVTGSGNYNIGGSGGVATVETPWGLAGVNCNAWIKPQNLTKHSESAEVAAAKKAG